jgi:hypothetical protein
MAALRTLIDGIPLATVSSSGFNILAVHVSGTRINEEFATIDVSGGIYPKDEQSTYLLWASDVKLLPHQVVTIQFLEEGDTSHAGKTIEEYFPDEPAFEGEDFTPTPEGFAKLRAMPSFRDSFNLVFESPLGNRVKVKTTDAEHGFSFSVVWDSTRPLNARSSLHSYSIQSMEDKNEGIYHSKEVLAYGDTVKLELLS